MFFGRVVSSCLSPFFFIVCKFFALRARVGREVFCVVSFILREEVGGRGAEGGREGWRAVIQRQDKSTATPPAALVRYVPSLSRMGVSKNRS